MVDGVVQNSIYEEQSKQDTIYGAPEGQDARILADLAAKIMADDRILIHVAMDDRRVQTLKSAIKLFAPETKVAVFPAWDCLPYDRVSPSSDIVAHRVSTLCKLLNWSAEKKRMPRIVLTTVNAAFQKVTPVAAFENASFLGRKNGRFDQDKCLNFLVNSGYIRTETVREAGEFAVRGGIVDIFPAGKVRPIRLDLFGDEIESIKAFDPITQRSVRELGQFSLIPATEFFMDDASVEQFRGRYRDLFGVRQSHNPLYDAVSDGRKYNGMDHWMPLFFDGMETLFDYTSNPFVTQDQHAVQSQHERWEQVCDFYETRKTLEQANNKQKKSKDISLTGGVYHPLVPSALYLEHLPEDSIVLSPFKNPALEERNEATKVRNFSDVRAKPEEDLFKAVRDYCALLRVQKRKVLISAFTKGSRDRLKSMLEAGGMENLQTCETAADVKALDAYHVGLVTVALETGFVASDLALLTEQDILGDRLVRTTKKRKKADNFLKEVSSLNAGDLVVHLDHGVGRFVGLETIKAAGTIHDCLVVVYSGEDKLFVPVENIEVLSRYGSEDSAGQLDKLGGAGWQARKARIKKDLMRIADHLMKIAAERELRTGEKLIVSEDLYTSFSSKFIYQETDDQLRAIENVVEDMGSGRPMDRLICGDVGFGKTEVAIRAAYVAATSGVQVAIIAPTTLLVRQHALNFQERFKGSGLRVEQLSRFVSAKDSKYVKEGLMSGDVSIVVGTHALLAESIKFNNLGLVVIDEEQRFGVKQKERLKDLRADVHVLTMTATPIPRTLQMSLAGVKEMSIIATPPVDRLAIRTFVLPFDGMVVREALLREYHRGGQSFYVCPRVKDIREVEEHLKDLVPELKVISAHGQMTPTDLEDRMNAFVDKQYDVLLATNIIESGIDIPTANTMIVHRADMFGLAQLYQIRGRIGRSKVRAYAYLTYTPNKVLTAQAMKRLEVLETLDTLGAGFQLASHDMDIRGAGNLVGEEQSGHIKEVGVELYQQMLEEAVAAARAGIDLNDMPSEDGWTPNINLGMSILIPEQYVSDLSVRMSLYRRLPDLEGATDVEIFAAEMIDRFGDLPKEVENLLEITKIKQLCKQAGIDRVDAGPKGAMIGFHNDQPPAPDKLISWISAQRGTVKIRPDQRLSVVRTWENPEQRVKGIWNLIKNMMQ